MTIESTESGNVHVRILVRGRVQGVGFRKTARQQARRLGIEVIARNQEDGTVLLETSGPQEAVDQLVAWSRRGPVLAEVDDITVISTSRPENRLD